MRLRGFDEIDLRILAELQRDGRVTFQDLSQIVGLSPRPCLERVRRLERGGVIMGYTARVDVRRLVNPVIVIAQIQVEQEPDTHAPFEEQMHNCPEIVECLEVRGAFNYIVKVVSPSINSYRELSEAWINDTSMRIVRIESHVVLHAAKDEEVYPVTVVDAQSGRDP